MWVGPDVEVHMKVERRWSGIVVLLDVIMEGVPPGKLQIPDLEHQH